MFYQYEELHTKQDYMDLFDEINAYCSLDGEDFDFGDGLIKNDMSYGSEDAYYKMDMMTIEETIQWWNWDNKKNSYKRSKIKNNRHYLNKKEKRHIEHLYQISWMNVIDNGEWKQRVYRGKRSAFLKKWSNKKIRNYNGELPKKGNNHHKVFDFWWELY